MTTPSAALPAALPEPAFRLAPDAPDEASDGSVTITLQTFGASRIMLGEQVFGMHNALLFMLVLRMAYAPGMAVRRDVVLQEFWPDQDDARQRGNLRQALYKLRNMGVRAALQGDMVQLDVAQVVPTFCLSPSVDAFERDITRGSHPYGIFLPGVTAPTDALHEWLEQTRERMHGAVRRVLVEILRSRRERADWKGSQMVAQWLLQLDPLNEEGTLTLAECAALSGSKVEAVAILDRFLGELGAGSSDIRLPATLLRRRFAEVPQRRRSVALVTDKYFLGREQELSELTMSLRRARWHDGSAVLLHGPPGMGKTRVMAEVLKVAQFEGYRDVVIECRDSITARPLGALIEALPELLSAPGAIGCAPESLVVLRKLLGNEQEKDKEKDKDTDKANDDTAEAEASADDGAPAREPARELTQAERIDLAIRTMRAQSIRHAVVDLFAAVSEERPIFVLAEDVHWMDDASWEVLSDVMQRVNEMRVYIVLTSRFATVREERPARVPTTLRYRKLPPLAEGALAALVRGAARDENVNVPEGVERWIISGCEGNPMMLRALLEHWAVTGNAEGVPPSLTTLIDQRIDRLDAHAQQALQAISLLGRFASLERIKLVLELPVHELIHALEQLELSGCLSTSHASLVITHDLVRQVSLRRMSPLVEAALRAAIGDTLEAEYMRTGDLEILLEALSHTELSGRPDVLHRFILKHDEALVMGDRPSTVLRAIDTLHRSMPVTKQERRITRLQTNQESQNGASGRALALLPAGMTLPADPRALKDPEIDECLSFVEAAYRSSPTTDPVALAVFASNIARNPSAPFHLRTRAADIGLLIASNTCDTDVANACYLGLQLSEQSIQEDERTQKIALMYHTVFGSIDVAVRLADQMIKRNADARPTAQRVVECGRAGYVYRMTGKGESANKAFTKSIELAKEIEAPRLAEYPIWQLAQLSLETGDLTGALHWTAELQKLGESNADEAANNYINGHLCLMAIALNRKKDAETAYRRVQRALAGRRPLRTQAFSIGLELGVAMMDRRWVPSAEHIDSAIARFEASSGFCASDFLAAKVGEALIRAGRSAEATALLSNYMKKMRREQAAPTAFLKPILKHLGLNH